MSLEALSLLGAVTSPGAVAAIGAAAGIAGAVAGAAASGIATFKIEGQRQDFERRRLLRVEREERRREITLTRGAARMMSKQFDDARAILRTSIDSEGWWRTDVALDIDLPVEDMRRIASACD